MVKGQDFACPCSNLPFLFISEAHGMPCSHTHEISGRRHINLLVRPIKTFLYCSRMSATAADVNYSKNFCKSVKKTVTRRKSKRKQGVGDDLSVCVLNILPKVSSLPKVLTVKLTKVEIKDFQMVTWRHVGHFIKGSCLGASYTKTAPCLVWCPYVFCRWRYVFKFFAYW